PAATAKARAGPGPGSSGRAVIATIRNLLLRSQRRSGGTTAASRQRRHTPVRHGPRGWLRRATPRPGAGPSRRGHGQSIHNNPGGAAMGQGGGRIEARGLTKRYGATLAVDELSFAVQPGVVTGFLGPNGSGKSTTM